MPKAIRVHWTRRQHGRSKAARRAPLPKKEALLVAAVFAVMATPWIVMPALTPQPENDVHVVSLDRTAVGYRAPFEKGWLELRFVGAGGARRARLELFAAGGERLVPEAPTMVYLELPGSGVERRRVDFRREGMALVSAAPAVGLADRSTLIFEEERTRHVYALEGS